MTLTFSYSPLVLVLCLLAAAGLTYWTYRRTVPAVGRGRLYLLMGLRFMALALVLLLLAEPVLRWLQQETQPPVVAVLVDDSQSLGLVHDSLDLAESVRTALRNTPLDALNGEVRYFTFGQDVTAVASLDSLRFGAVRTNIAEALTRVADDLRNENLKGVVLISDGQYNTGRNPLYVAERYPVPVHTVVVGDTTQQRDVQVRRVTTNEVAYVDAELPVQVGLRAEGYAGQQATVSLFEGGERRAVQTVTLPPGVAEVPLDLALVPRTEGLQRYTVRVNRFPGEVTYANNTTAFTVRVLKRKQRILVFAGAPTPDLAALRQTLAEDPDLEVTTFTQQGGGRFYEGTPPATFEGFDALVMAGYPGARSDPALVRRIAAAVTEGKTPLLFLMGRQTNLSLVREAFADALPATPRTIRTGFVEAAFDVQANGRVHPILNMGGVPDNGWHRLPPLTYSESSWTASPDARTLATVQVRGVALDDPLLIVRSRGQVRTAALLGAGVWRWKNMPDDLEDLQPFWPDLFANLLQWITTREDNRPVRVRPVRDLFGGGEPVQFSGQVYDESLNPVDGASVAVQVTTPDGNQLDYQMEALGNGRYILNAGALPEGTYGFTATGTGGGNTLGQDAGSFAVGALTLEFRETRADAALMRQMARRSNGLFLTADAVTTLPDQLNASGSLNPTVVAHEREAELWRRYAFLIAIIAFLGLEWFLRKRSGMV